MRLQELSLFRCLIGILRRARTLAQIRRPKPPLHRYRCPHDRPRINCHGGTESRRLLPGNPLRSRVRNSEVWYKAGTQTQSALAVALAGYVETVPLIIWCAYSSFTALLLLFRHVKNRGHLPRSFQRAAKKLAIYAVLLALPWSSLGVLYLGSLPEDQELILVALGIGMAACATVLLSAIPRAAFIYTSVILIPTACKCLHFSQKSYLLLGTLALSYWGCLAVLIAKTARDIKEHHDAELALAERDLQLALAARAGLVGSYAYDATTETVQISPGYAAIHGLPEGTTEITRSEWLAHVHPQDVQRLQVFRSEALGNGRGEYNVDYRIVRRDGEVRWIESRGVIGSDTIARRLIG